jgi:peptide-methionine (R)-S-oxide reductase
MLRLIAKPIAFALTLGAFLLPRGCDLTDTNQLPSPEKPPAADALPLENTETAMNDKIEKTDAEWRKALTPEQYQILRRKGTERPFTGKYDHFFQPGVYLCAGCGTELFASDDKYNSGCGWPAFSQPAEKEALDYSVDRSHGMIRTEVTCARCGGHLGHVFNDGPQPTGRRYCINSEALEFQKKTSNREPQ